MKKFLLSVSGDQKLLANSRLEFIASTVKSSLFLEKGKFYYLCFSVNPFICVSDSSKRMLALKKPSICRYAITNKLDMMPYYLCLRHFNVLCFFRPETCTPFALQFARSFFSYHLSKTPVMFFRITKNPPSSPFVQSPEATDTKARHEDMRGNPWITADMFTIRSLGQ